MQVACNAHMYVVVSVGAHTNAYSFIMVVSVGGKNIPH